MQVRDPMHWHEQLDESINYWFWLRRLGMLSDGLLLDKVRRTVALSEMQSHDEVSRESRFGEYLETWRQWKRNQAMRHTREVQATPPSVLRSHYKQVAATGVGHFTVQWVMAPFGEQWLIPPSTVILGADGGTPEDRRNAVLVATVALAAAS